MEEFFGSGGNMVLIPPSKDAFAIFPALGWLRSDPLGFTYSEFMHAAGEERGAAIFGFAEDYLKRLKMGDPYVVSALMEDALPADRLASPIDFSEIGMRLKLSLSTLYQGLSILNELGLDSDGIEVGQDVVYDAKMLYQFVNRSQKLAEEQGIAEADGGADAVQVTEQPLPPEQVVVDPLIAGSVNPLKV